MNKIEVWGIGGPRNLRVHWMLEELGQSYIRHPLRTRSDAVRTDDYRKLNPLEKVPTMRHGNFVLRESAAIAIYLSETFSRPKNIFVPADAKERAKLHEWCFFIMTELDALSLYVIRRHVGLRKIFGNAPNAVKAAREYFEKLMQTMVGSSNTKGFYLIGNQLSVADVLMVTCIDWALLEQLDVPEEWMQYRLRITCRPEYKIAYEYNNSLN